MATGDHVVRVLTTYTRIVPGRYSIHHIVFRNSLLQAVGIQAFYSYQPRAIAFEVEHFLVFLLTVRRIHRVLCFAHIDHSTLAWHGIFFGLVLMGQYLLAQYTGGAGSTYITKPVGG